MFNYTTEDKQVASCTLCPKCKCEIPLIKLNITKASQEILLKCSCSDTEQHIPLTTYLSQIQSLSPDNPCPNHQDDLSHKSISYCKQCESYLCKDCLITHNKTMVNHLGSLTSIKINDKCHQHPSFKLDLLCKECSLPICAMCIDQSHKGHKILNKEYFIKKVSSRNLYQSFTQIKTSYALTLELFNQVYKYLTTNTKSIPYLHDHHSIKEPKITYEYLTERMQRYKDENNVLIELVESLFTTYETDNNSICALFNMVTNCVFNAMLLNDLDAYENISIQESDEGNEEIDFGVSSVTIKDYIRDVVAQTHFNIIAPDLKVDVLSYLHLSTLTCKTETQFPIKYMNILNDNETILTITDDKIFFFSSHEHSPQFYLECIQITSNPKQSITMFYQLENNDILFITNTCDIHIYSIDKQSKKCSFNIIESKFSNVNSTRIMRVVEYAHTKIAVCSSDNLIRLYDLEMGVHLHVLSGHVGISCIIKLNEYLLATSGYVDDTIMIWDVEQGVCLKRLKPHCKSIITMYCVEKDEIFFSASSDRTVMVWQCKTLECLKKFDVFEREIGIILEITRNRIALCERGKFCVWIVDKAELEITIKVVTDATLKSMPMFMVYLPKEECFANEDNQDIELWCYEP